MTTPAPAHALTPVLLLLEEGGALRAVTVAGEVRAFDSLAQLAAACKPGKVVVSPPLSDCLAAEMPTTGLPKGKVARDAALLYRLEEHLPWDAERMAAAFTVTDAQVLGIAVLHEQLQPRIAELEAAGWQAEALVPWPLLALAGLPTTLKGGTEVLVLHDGLTRAWIEHREGQATRWLHQPEIEAEIAHWTASKGHPPQLAHYGDAANRAHPHDPLALAALGAAQALKSPWDIPGDLRVGPLAKGNVLERLQLPLGMAWAAACFLALAVLAVAWNRARAYEAQAVQIKEAERRLYQEVYPGETPPEAVGSRLDALVRSLPPPGTETTNVLPAVGALFKGLSVAPQLRLDEIQLRPNQLFLSGSAQSAGDTAKVADALRGPFLMDTPRLERRTNDQSGGVQFTLTGKPQVGKRDSK